MPPDITRNPLPTPVVETPDPDLDAVVSFFDLRSIGAAIRANEFDVEQEVTKLINMIRDPDPAVSLAAQRAYRALLKEAANANGLIGKHEVSRVSQDEGGALIREHASTSRLLTSILTAQRTGPRASPERHLPHGAPGEVPPPHPPLRGDHPLLGPNDPSAGRGPGDPGPRTP